MFDLLAVKWQLKMSKENGNEQLATNSSTYIAIRIVQRIIEKAY